jgi:hypothetical protein
LPGLPKPAANASAPAAVAAAAHATLSSLYPSQKAFFDRKHTHAGLMGAGLTEGHDFGLLVAQAILDKRKDDPGASDNGYANSMAYGSHRADPDNPEQGVHAPFYGARSRCFAVTDRHELDVPPQPGSPEYIAAVKQVRGKGIAPELMGTLLPSDAEPRTPEETVIGIYWGYDGANELGTPPRLYNQIVRAVAIARNNSTDQNARLFAMVNTAMADAGVLAWDQKFIHDVWRPVLGVREHDSSFGPTGVGNSKFADDADPGWLPLGAPNSNAKFSPEKGMPKNGTPPFPAYPSGHATFGAAALHITRLFYGVGHKGDDKMFDGLTFVSDELDGVTRDNRGTIRPRHNRKFPGGLWQMIEENGLSRVYLGVHWVYDAFALDAHGKPDLSRNVGGVPLGLTIAEDIYNNGLNLSSVGPRC